MAKPGEDLQATGSSPLARGKHRRRQGRRRERLIPARAGKTPPANTPRRASWAHPRSRGENRAAKRRNRLQLGSSPLARGKRDETLDEAPARGLIPARAGKTTLYSAATSFMTAHPRSRGENAALSPSCTSVVGSSPLARGKHGGHEVRRQRRRLIPARAGKTRTSPALTRREQAHPRSRGENWRAGLRHIYCPGSSPLARGKPATTSQPIAGVGLIPARAGKTARSPCTREATWAHPRSRGENHSPCPVPTFIHGSSPLARGKPRRRHRPRA